MGENRNELSDFSAGSDFYLISERGRVSLNAKLDAIYRRFYKLSWKRLPELHLSAWPPVEYCRFAVAFLCSKTFFFFFLFFFLFFFFYKVRE